MKSETYRACLGISLFFFTGVVFYLAALWLWVNYCFWQMSKRFIAVEITRATVAKQMASRKFFTLLADMNDASDAWSLYNGIRFLLTVVIASSALVIAQTLHNEGKTNTDNDSSESNGYSASLILYSMVWIAAAAPGWVSDKVWSHIQLDFPIHVATA